MKKRSFSSLQIASVMVILALSIYFLFVAKAILVPLIFALLISLMLVPVADVFEAKLPRLWSILMTMLVSIIPVAGVILFFSFQFSSVLENMPDILGKVEAGYRNATNFFMENFGMSKSEGKAWIEENGSSLMEAPMAFVSSGLTASTSTLINCFVTFVYTFLILLYRGSIKEFYLVQFDEEAKERAYNVLKRIQKLTEQYLVGMVSVVGILGVLNSIGLSIIGVDYPFFWGFLAAFLAIIPYVGTMMGSFLPFLYSLATFEEWWQPVAVAFWFGMVQILEGNVITPKVVGSSISINPLAAIIALIIGGHIWGVAGMVLSLPLIAIMKVIFSQIDALKPVSLLLSDELYDKEDKFEEAFDQRKYRLFSFLKK